MTDAITEALDELKEIAGHAHPCETEFRRLIAAVEYQRDEVGCLFDACKADVQDLRDKYDNQLLSLLKGQSDGS